MERDPQSDREEPSQARFSSPFDALRPPPAPRGEVEERLEILRCDPFAREAPTDENAENDESGAES